MNWSMIEYIPIEMCQYTFTKTITSYFGTIYTEMQSKSPEEVTTLARKLLTDDMNQKLFQ